MSHGKDARRRSRRALVAASVAVALVVGLLAQAAAADPPATHPGTGHAMGDRAHQGGGGGGVKALIDHGGALLAASHVYTIWWGTSSAWSSDVQSGMASFFAGLQGSRYVNTATQYLRTSAASETVENAVADPTAPPASVKPSTLGAEVAKVFTTVDPLGMYFVFTSNFPSGGNFCAWHGPAVVDGVSVSVEYMPNTSGVAGCDPGNLYNLSGSQGLRSLANVTAHEFMESVTDPQLSAWYDSSGSEIGDKCAWRFGSAVTLSNSSTWQLQEEWSNAARGCVQTTP